MSREQFERLSLGAGIAQPPIASGSQAVAFQTLSQSLVRESQAMNSPFVCPCCTSDSVSVGISTSSYNVVQFCNDCNFRDIIYYADNSYQAEQYCKRLYRFFRRTPVRLRRVVVRAVSSVPKSTAVLCSQARWNNLEKVPPLQLRDRRLDDWSDVPF